MANINKIKAKKPTPLLLRPLKINVKDLLISISKVIINFAASRNFEAAAELPALVASLGLEEGRGGVAWTLVIRGFQRAICDIMSAYIDSNDILEELVKLNWKKVEDRNLEFTIGSDFFENPSRGVILKDLEEVFKEWLIEAKIPKPDIENLSGRLRGIFAICLHNEWRSEPTRYDIVKDDLISPFLPSAHEELEWSYYNSYLSASIDEKIFEESFSLRQIFVEPRACSRIIDSPANEKVFPVAIKSGPERNLKAFDLFASVRHWIKEKNKSSPIRLISGGPGTGKSSFSKMLAARLADDKLLRVLMVPLHQISTEEPLAKAVGEYFSTGGFFKKNPLEKLDPEVLTVLILDGLDEIQMQGKASQEAAQQLIGDLMRMVEVANTQSCKILAVVCGRDISIQATESRFRLDGEVIHLLPYYVPEYERDNYENGDILRQDQRDLWWNTYGNLKGLGFKGIPEALKKGELGEVTAQPLLNYLVALSYQRGGIKLDSTTNINAVYADLLVAVFERGWARHNHPAVQNISFNDFVRLLEEVALSVWHGAGRTATLKEVEEHCKQSKIGNLLPSFELGAAGGVSSLLLAFYFRQKGRRQDGDKTFEFTHKSFGEYLTSLRIVRTIELISKKMAAHAADKDEGWDEVEALVHWLSVCGPATLDEYLLAFIRREVLLKGSDVASKWQLCLVRLLEYALHKEWPIQKIGLLSFANQLKWVRNAEETLLCALNACARVSYGQSKIKWPSPSSFGEMLRRVQGQRIGPPNTTLFSSLSFFDLSRQCLDMADLYKVDISNSNLSGCDLHYTVLLFANLSNCDLTGARFEETNIFNANISGAIFSDKFLPSELIGEYMIYRSLGSKQDHDKFQRDKFVKLKRLKKHLIVEGAKLLDSEPINEL